MSQIKISALNDLNAAPASDDKLVIVDTSAGETKRIDINDLFTNPDVTGTLTADGLTVDGDISLTASGTERFAINKNLSPLIEYRVSTDNYHLSLESVGSSQGDIKLYTGTSSAIQRANFASNGDISFYEDTGTTAKFFWDASAERLGIGTTNPSSTLEISAGAANTYFRINDTRGSVPYIGSESGNTTFGLWGSTEAMRLDTSGHLIIPAGVTLGTAAGVYNAANTLDDYETGTWTPTITGSTSGSITGFTVNKAVYVKVGDLVTVGVYLAGINMTTSTCSGTIQLGNLPFTANSFTGVPLVSFCNMFSFDESDVSISGYVSGNNILLHRGSSTTVITDSDEGTSTSASLMFSLTYEV